MILKGTGWIGEDDIDKIKSTLNNLFKIHTARMEEIQNDNSFLWNILTERDLDVYIRL